MVLSKIDNVSEVRFHPNHSRTALQKLYHNAYSNINSIYLDVEDIPIGLQHS